MPKRKLPPTVGEIPTVEFKSRKRRIKMLAEQRLGFGVSAFFDTKKRQAKYPMDEIATAHLKAEHKARKAGLKLKLTEQEKVWREQLFEKLSEQVKK